MRDLRPASERAIAASVEIAMFTATAESGLRAALWIMLADLLPMIFGPVLTIVAGRLILPSASFCRRRSSYHFVERAKIGTFYCVGECA
jgi:hypothetical protein